MQAELVHKVWAEFYYLTKWSDKSWKNHEKCRKYSGGPNGGWTGYFVVVPVPVAVGGNAEQPQVSQSGDMDSQTKMVGAYSHIHVSTEWPICQPNLSQIRWLSYCLKAIFLGEYYGVTLIMAHGDFISL